MILLPFFLFIIFTLIGIFILISGVLAVSIPFVINIYRENRNGS